jgi:hypothetical protein
MTEVGFDKETHLCISSQKEKLVRVLNKITKNLGDAEIKFSTTKFLDTFGYACFAHFAQYDGVFVFLKSPLLSPRYF